MGRQTVQVVCYNHVFITFNMRVAERLQEISYFIAHFSFTIAEAIILLQDKWFYVHIK